MKKEDGIRDENGLGREQERVEKWIKGERRVDF